MAWLEKDGRVNYQVLFAKDGTSSPPSPAQSSQPPVEKPWQISLDELAVTNYQVQFTDQSNKKPQTFKLSALNFNLQKFEYPKNEKLPVQFSAVFNDAGKLKVGGDISLTPFTANLAIDINDIKLKTFQSYIDPYLNLNLVNGAFNTHGNLQLTAADDLQLLFQGNANVNDLTTRDKIDNKDFLNWNDLQLQQIDIDLAKRIFTLGMVVIDQPYVRITIQKDKSTNIDKIIASQPASQSVTAQPAKTKTKTAPSQNSPKISIVKILLKDGDSDFADYSLILPFIARMNSLNGQVEGFTSDQDTPLKLQLQGKAYNLAPVVIKGSYQLKSGDSDISLKFTQMPLPLITPYMADFAGYKIEKGQMSLDLRYKINQKQLEAQNKIFIDQLTLGDQVENPHASSLPLHLAIALLKDADGKINLDFPVTGSLDDPQFSIGSLIVDVLSNLISKLVTAPFKALGGLFSSDSGNDYSSISFAPGSADLKAEESAKLDQLSTALKSKPDLSLEIKGMAFQSLDWPVLRLDALNEILKKMKSGELRDKGENIRSEYIKLSDDEYKRLLAKFFKEVFPQEIDFSLLGKPRIKAQPDADFYDVARQKLEDILQPDPQRLNDMAVARASAISKYLTEKAGLDISRIFILAPEIDPANTTGIVSVLSLNVAH